MTIQLPSLPTVHQRSTHTLNPVDSAMLVARKTSRRDHTHNIHTHAAHTATLPLVPNTDVRGAWNFSRVLVKCALNEFGRFNQIARDGCLRSCKKTWRYCIPVDK